MDVTRWIIFGLALASPFTAFARLSPAERLWYDEAAPLLDKYCTKCHGGVRQKSGLDLRSLETVLHGGERGSAIVPGKPEESHIVQFVLSEADPHMPPDEKKQLKPEEIAVLKKWIAALPKLQSTNDLSGTNTAWVSGYVADLKKMEKPAWVPPAKLAASKVIDGFIKQGWKDRKVEPAKVCDDRTYVRRLYLDLSGRVPTEAEAGTFLKDKDKDKRARLVDQLLAGDDYARHMSDVFDVVLMTRRDDRRERQRKENGWLQYLETSFRENRPWNQMVHDMIVARSDDSERRGSFWFLYERRDNYQAMAEAIAPVAFGVHINCAQCHNHPLAWEIEQRHYWGLVTAFNRSKNVDSEAGKGVAESAIGGFVNFANLKKESQPALMAFLNGKSVPEKRPGENEKETDSPDLYLVPPPKEKAKAKAPSVPKFSRREALADAVTEDNPLLARAFVNRAWAMLMGRGLIHPVDQMDSRHRPSHPELLDWLANDFQQSGYDIRRLIQNIVLSRAYQLDSVGKGLPDAFAHALEKPLSAEQLYLSFITATGNPVAKDGKVAGHDADDIRRAFVTAFPDLFATENNASLQQAMFLSNSPLLDDLLKRSDGNLTARLLATDSMEARVQNGFQAVLGRSPDKEELAQSVSYLKAREPEPGVKQFLWALLTSAEFQVNH